MGRAHHGSNSSHTVRDRSFTTVIFPILGIGVLLLGAPIMAALFFAATLTGLWSLLPWGGLTIMVVSLVVAAGMATGNDKEE